MAPLLLGLDCGLSATKAVLFGVDGEEQGKAVVKTTHSSPRPHWVERDMDVFWLDCTRAISAAIEDAGANAKDIVCVGLTGHGDGVYLVDEQYRPVRPAIVSLDSRAVDIVEHWRSMGIVSDLLRVTGQRPWPGSPAALLAWLKVNEPEPLGRARFLLSCKDWVKLRLTDRVSTDPTEANPSFCDVTTQTYSVEALRLFGLETSEPLLPGVIESCGVAGEVTMQAAAQTGLSPGTPVVSGLHDTDACAVANGCIEPGRLMIIAGTFSINETVSRHPVVDPRWSCRNFIAKGRWMNSARSPASTTNLDWFVREILREPSFHSIDEEVAAAVASPRDVWFTPFLYGSPLGDDTSAGFVGLRGWHRRADMLRALFEGVVFNHKMHVDALTSVFSISDAWLTGGGSRSQVWCQMFADALGMPVSVSASGEAGALGAAACAGVGVGLFPTIESGIDRMLHVAATYEPTSAGEASLRDGYEKYRELIRALGPFWTEVSHGRRGADEPSDISSSVAPAARASEAPKPW
jgi:L-xylulokinase